jgi:hypothetical protein
MKKPFLKTEEMFTSCSHVLNIKQSIQSLIQLQNISCCSNYIFISSNIKSSFVLDMLDIYLFPIRVSAGGSSHCGGNHDKWRRQGDWGFELNL